MHHYFLEFVYSSFAITVLKGSLHLSERRNAQRRTDVLFTRTYRFYIEHRVIPHPTLTYLSSAKWRASSVRKMHNRSMLSIWFWCLLVVDGAHFHKLSIRHSSTRGNYVKRKRFELKFCANALHYFSSERWLATVHLIETYSPIARTVF